MKPLAPTLIPHLLLPDWDVGAIVPHVGVQRWEGGAESNKGGLLCGKFGLVGRAGSLVRHVGFDLNSPKTRGERSGRKKRYDGIGSRH